MTLKVHDFYTKEKISTNRYHNILMQNCTFYILVSNEGNSFRELSLYITKKYHYERSVSYGKFSINKANEYNVLVDYIHNNTKALKEKWHLTDIEFEELLEGLEKILVQRYSTGSGLSRWLLFAAVCIKLFMKKFNRRIRS